MSGKKRAFAQKMEYQHQGSSSSGISGASQQQQQQHRPLSQRSSVDSTSHQERKHQLRAHSLVTSAYSEDGSGSGSINNVFQAIADPFSAVTAHQSKNSVRSASSRTGGSVSGANSSYTQMASPVPPSSAAAGPSHFSFGASSSAYHVQPFTDSVIDPVDFEVCVVQCPAEIADYPDKDLQLEYSSAKELRKTSLMYDDESSSEFKDVSKHVADCLNQYSKRLCIIHRSCASLSPQFFNTILHLHKVLRMISLLPYEEKSGEETLTRPASSLFLQSASAESSQDAELEKLLKLIHENVNDSFSSYRQLRQSRRFPELMSLFMLDVPAPAVDRSLRPDLEQPISYISVKCISHDTKLNFEPLFFSMFLYDLNAKQKLSETFHFDGLEPWMFAKLRNYISYNNLDPSSRLQEAVFSLSQPTDELYIVVRIEKVLQPGEVQSTCEPYLHVEKHLKQLEKLKTQASFWCESLGAYRMPFAWTATNLISAINNSESQPEVMIQRAMSPMNDDAMSEFSGTDSCRSLSSSSLGGRRASSSLSNRIPELPGSGSGKAKSLVRGSLFKNEENFSNFLSNFHPVDLKFKSFFIQDLDRLSDEDVATSLIDFKKDKGRKFKSVDIEMSLEIRPVNLSTLKCLTPDLQVINCSSNENPTCRMVLDFPVQPVAKPYSEYINLLYVYPKTLNLHSRAGTARNILMKVKLAQGTQHGPIVLTKIFGKSTESALKDVALCPVNYHTKVPRFYEEIKMQLPATLGQFHHLLFEFYHITCNSNKRDGSENESFVGATWLPLLDDNKRLVVGNQNLPVSSDRLPSDYYRVHPKVPLPSIKWLDGHKELFNVSINACSSVHTMDQPLDNFLRQYAAIFNQSHFSSASKQETIQIGSAFSSSMDCLKKEASIGSLIHFLHVTMDKLISLIVRKQVVNGNPLPFAHNAFEALVTIVDRLHDSRVNTFVDMFNRVQLLLSYVQNNLDVSDFQYDTRGEKISNSSFHGSEVAPGVYRKQLHTELLIEIMAAKQDRPKLMQRIWFFFEIVIKSLAYENILNTQMGLPRLHSFDDCLNGDIGSVISNVTQYINQLCSSASPDIKSATLLNFYLAFFVSDLFSVCNRYWVFNYIKSYIIQMNSFIDKLHRDMTQEPNALISLKLDFLRVISTHEHFVILNLPFYSESANMFDIPSFRASTISSVSQVSTSTLSADSVVADTLSVEFKQTHFLMGLLLQEFKLLLPLGIPSLQKIIVCILCQIAQFIDRDSRYSQPFVKSKVVALFLPLIKIIIAHKDQLAQGPAPFLDSAFRSAEASHELETKKNKIAGIEVSTPNNNSNSCLSLELTRNILSLFLWVFKNLDSELLFNWWAELSEPNLVKLLQVVRMCVQVFEYRGRDVLNNPSVKNEEAKQRIEGLLFGDIGARNELMMRRRPFASSSSSRNQSATSSLVRNRWDKSSTANLTCSELNSDENEKLVCESNICCETVLVCLDLTDYMLEIVSLGSLSTFMIKECVSLMAEVLSRNQTNAVYLSCLNLLRIAVKEHAQFILLEDSDLCAELCLRLLRISCVKDAQVRSQAIIVLYLIMRLCFDLTRGNSLTRLKIQLIVALSSLVNILDQDKAANLQISIRRLSTFSSKDSELIQTTFPAQIEDLAGNLHGILLNTIKMHEFDKDPEMHMDLMYQVAKGYQSSIQLRLTWLENMRVKHKERENFAEAAMCSLHSAAFVCEGLYSIEQSGDLPIGATVFEDVTENVLEECIFDYSAHGWSSFNHSLSKDKIVIHLEEAAKYFFKAQLFEFAIKCYQHLIDMHKGNKCNYKTVSEYHKKIEENYEKIMSLEECGKRSYSTFFRVGFYGRLFEDLDGKEYVYKEAPYAQLSVISHRLEAFYQERFGLPNVVEILKSSNLVERRNLDPNKAYIQVTYVEPYFDYYREVELTTSGFERNTNISEFVYNIPFTKSGKPHGGLKEQLKKRVVLRTEQMFPYLKTRLEVINRTEEILSPIQVAKEDLNKKLDQFEAVLRLKPEESLMFDASLSHKSAALSSGGGSLQQVDGKRLQLILQGCIGTQVNQGPTEIALTFLNVDDIDADGGSRDGEWTIEHDDLRLLFKKFLRLCKKGLAENRKLIKADQVEYEAQLQRDFEKMKSIVNPLLHNRGPGWISHTFNDLERGTSDLDMNGVSNTNAAASLRNFVQQQSHSEF